MRTGRVHVQLEDCLKALRPRNLKVMRSLHDVNEMMDRVLQVFEGFLAESPSGAAVPCYSCHMCKKALVACPTEVQTAPWLWHALADFGSYAYSICHMPRQLSRYVTISRMSRSLSCQLPGNGDGVLDVNEFERCLEGIGLQLGNFNLI